MNHYPIVTVLNRENLTTETPSTLRTHREKQKEDAISYTFSMMSVFKPGFLRIFFAVSACSWMPHWACHYYRLETRSSFVVGSWAFSFQDSVVSLLIYSLLIGSNLVAIHVERYRSIVAGTSALGHVSLGALHLYRLIYPFTFEVFGHPWSRGASLREAAVVLPFGLVSAVVAFSVLGRDR